MKEIIGGCWIAGILAMALLGIVPGLVLLLLGAGAGIVAGVMELLARKQKEEAEQAWRKNYPSYKY